MKNKTLGILKKYYHPVGLTVTGYEWLPKEDGTFPCSATLLSLNGENLTRNPRTAIYEPFSVEASCPKKVVPALFQIMKNEKIWVGPYNGFHAVIEWHEKRKAFLRRELTPEEKLEKNFSL